jgi:hypothetical protein
MPLIDDAGQIRTYEACPRESTITTRGIVYSY